MGGDKDKGGVLILATFMMVMLLILVGMGLDVGILVHTRAVGQTAVDASALAAATGIPNLSQVHNRAAVLNNVYPGSRDNPITANNVQLVKYDADSDTFQVVSDIAVANGARVSLKIKSPVFLMQLAGVGAPSTSVTATAVLKARADLPLALKGCGLGFQNINACWTVYTRPQSGLLEEMIRNVACQSIPPVKV